MSKCISRNFKFQDGGYFLFRKFFSVTYVAEIWMVGVLRGCEPIGSIQNDDRRRRSKMDAKQEVVDIIDVEH